MKVSFLFLTELKKIEKYTGKKKKILNEIYTTIKAEVEVKDDEWWVLCFTFYFV